MSNYNINNEIVKKQYEEYLELDEGLSSKTIHTKVKDIRKYEEFTNFKDFSTFNKNKALDFKGSYKKGKSPNDKQLEYATIWRSLKNIKEFFTWLSRQPKYKSKIKLDDVRAFNLTKKEENIAKAKGIEHVPTLEQVYKVARSMLNKTEQERRNQAIFALVIVTGIRINALISLKIKHVDEYKRLVHQDPRDVKTKFSKEIPTAFFSVAEDIQQIVIDWIKFLKEEKAFGLNAPLFPAMLCEYDNKTKEFKREVLSQDHIYSTTVVSDIFKVAFASVGMEYFNPHSFRKTLTQLGERVCQTPEEFKAWSQNLGHSSPLTTFTSYGDIPTTRQFDIIRKLGDKN